METVSRMRTVKGIAEYFKQVDPGTTVNEYMVRRLVKEGKIPAVNAGNKVLINLDKFIEYLNNDLDEQEQVLEPEYGKLRKIME